MALFQFRAAASRAGRTHSVTACPALAPVRRRLIHAAACLTAKTAVFAHSHAAGCKQVIDILQRVLNEL